MGIGAELVIQTLQTVGPKEEKVVVKILLYLQWYYSTDN